VRAAVYYGTGDVRIEDVADPAPAAGELLLEIHAVGICGTDVGEFLKGPVSYTLAEGTEGLIPGHELSGRIVAVGAGVDGFEPGETVASGAGISCGTCFQCRAGRTNLCLSYSTIGLQRHGGLAQYCAVPAATCLAIEPFGLDEETAALAQPMAIAVHSLRRGRPAAGEHLVILGAGGIGAFLTYAAAQLGASVTVVDLVPDRLELARALGAENTLQPDARSLRERLDELGVKPTVIYEVTGSARVLDDAIDALVPGGRLVLVGLQNGPSSVDARRLTLSEVEFVGTNAHVCGADLPEALRLLVSRGGNWRDIAPTILPLSQLVDEGIQPMADGRGARVKTLIDPFAAAARSR
jgi:(R,R)-butanediol dehydrogenase / meso-butanediol dehydrogenase / diacetyl reductase